jgi:exodeoxyribonuclease V alpha subunit
MFLEDNMKIKGRVKSVVFASTTSLFKVLSVELDNGTISVTGEFPLIDEGALYEFEGVSKIHPKFGVQFEATSATSLKEETGDGLVLYLSSKFEGIGTKTAKAIVETLGIDAIDKIKNDIDALSQVKGISKKKAEDLREQIIKNSETETIFIKLFSYGLTKGAANKIYSKYESETLRKIEQNPYILIHDLDGFGFVRCDELAMRMGFDENSDLRLEEALVYNLSNMCESLGYTFIRQDDLLEETKLLLNRRSNNHIFESSDLVINLMNLVGKGFVVKEDNLIYPKNLYDAECNVSLKLKELLNNNGFNMNLDNIEKALKESESFIKFSLTDEQRKAIITSLSNPVSIITGGPGTGKTTILKCLLHTKALLLNLDMYSDAFQKKVLLLSPTGKASKRMMAQTEFHAQTIHKALQYDEFGHFLKNENDMLTEEFIIIDEASMIDIELMNHLLKAINKNTQIIFLGDVDQLPSVGPGNVLDDMIKSKMIKISYLTQIMRQKGDSKIVELAHMINEKRLDFSIFNDKKEVFFYSQDESNILNLTLRIVDRYIKSGADLYNDLQILVPMYSSLNGIDNINKQIQELFNKSNEYIKTGDKLFKVGDKVLQLQNDPKLDIMNGDTGVIKAITKNDDETFLYIMFDKMVKYPFSSISNLTLGYAISIHKAQGSEFKNVIIPISQAFRLMLRKKLVYTAITRAKEKVILIGNQMALNNALYQEDKVRQTTLARMLNPGLVGQKEINYQEITDPVSAFRFIMEDQMEGITPYTFLKEVGKND